MSIDVSTVNTVFPNYGMRYSNTFDDRKIVIKNNGNKVVEIRLLRIP